jgi:hypothetical protein
VVQAELIGTQTQQQARRRNSSEHILIDLQQGLRGEGVAGEAAVPARVSAMVLNGADRPTAASMSSTACRPCRSSTCSTCSC